MPTFTFVRNPANGDLTLTEIPSGAGVIPPQPGVLGPDPSSGGCSDNKINTICGFDAGTDITTANQTTLFGLSAGSLLTTETNNTLIGHDSGKILTGSDNTLLGSNSGNLLTTGTQNIIIGNSSGINFTSSESQNLLLYNPGQATDVDTIRIGEVGTHLAKTFIQGIHSTIPSGGGLENVTIDMDGHLGSSSLTVTSSSDATGVVAGGLLTINGGDTELFDISDGNGIIFNPVTQVKTIVTWSGLTAQGFVYVGDESFISIDSSGSMISSPTLPTNTEIRADIYLGQIVHLDQTNIIATLDEQMTLLSGENQIRDFMEAIGELKISGNILSSNSLLTIAKTAGDILKFGGNFANDVNNPHLPESGALDTNVADTFAYRWQDGSSRLSLTDIVPVEFDDGNGESAPGTVMVNQWSVQRVFTFSIGQMVIQQAQFVYGNESDAIANIESEGFIIEPDLSVSSVLIGFIVLRGGTSDLSSVDATFIEASKFGGSSVGTAAGVNGPASSTDNAIARWDTATGTIIQNSSILIDDSGAMTNISHIDIDHTALEDDDHAMELDVDADGFGDVKAIDIVYITGNISAANNEEAILVNIDETLSTGGRVVALEVLATDQGSAEIDALECGVGCNVILHQSGTFADADVILNIAVDVTTALSQGGAGNITLWVADNDTFTVQDAAKYSELEFIFDIFASGSGISPVFEFSSGSGPTTWTVFSPTDGTNGGRNNGIVLWNLTDIGAWVVGDSGNFEIRISRTRNSLVTTPRCDLLQISDTVVFEWNKDGDMIIHDIACTELIVSPSTALGIQINPFGISSGETGELRLLELAANGTNYVSFKSPDALASNTNYTLPSDDGNSSQVLETNGSGVLDWVSQSTGTGAIIKQFGSNDLLNSTDAAWSVSDLAPSIPDPDFAALSVRAFDASTSEAVGMKITMPPVITTLDVRICFRKSTAATGTVRFDLLAYALDSGGLVSAGSWNTANIIHNANDGSDENIVQDTTSFTLASLNLTQNEDCLLQISRNIADTYAADVYLISVELCIG